MYLARHSITATNLVNIFDARFDADCNIFTASTADGLGVYKTWPLQLIQKRDTEDGTLSIALPLHSTSLMFLVGGGRNPLYSPNKVVLWDADKAKEVVELEFKERVRGLACRRGLLAVALRRRAVVFKIETNKVERIDEWETSENLRGLIAMATAANSTLLAIPGRQVGHVQLIHLTPCPPPPPPSPPFNDKLNSNTRKSSFPIPHSTRNPVSIIVAHTSPLTTLTVPPSGRLLATTSEKGTLIRIWDAVSGKLVRELRRGTDRAEIYGVAFRKDELEVCVWSDKGTIHVFKLTEGTEGASNRQSTFSPLSNYIHKYFASQWSYAQFRLPASSTHISLNSASGPAADPDAAEEEKCVVGWIEVPIEIRPTSPSPLASPRSPRRGSTSSKPSSQPIAQPTEPQIRMEHQLVALTFSGGWYRLSIPNSSSGTGQSIGSRHSPTPLPSASGSNHERGSSIASSSGAKSPKAKALSIPRRVSSPSTSASDVEKRKDRDREADKDAEGKISRKLILEEFRRFGRWDGWG
ncbi:hypothetical protein FRC03_004981 [Tulasnella sp. 419]|nr:hypothetical protein FRC03_004981 [Tulasnella sp. 419]